MPEDGEQNGSAQGPELTPDDALGLLRQLAVEAPADFVRGVRRRVERRVVAGDLLNLALLGAVETTLELLGAFFEGVMKRPKQTKTETAHE